MTSPTDLKDKVAIVTGGSRGLGKAISFALAEHGCDVAVVSRKLPACEEVAQQLRELGTNSRAYACHVSHWDQVDEMVENVYRDFGKVDVLVNNAGMSPQYPSLMDVSSAMFDSVIGVNLKGPFRLCANVGSRMHAGVGGSIINISSVASEKGFATSLPYSAAKAGLNILAKGFATAFTPNVRINTISPGYFTTDISDHWVDPPDPESPGWSKAGLRIGLPEEMVGAILYLASDASSYTNDALLRIDGGPVRASKHVRGTG